jgi:RHS repeat-associated protein
MNAAKEVTEELSDEMNDLISVAGEVPAEARHGGLESAANALLGQLDGSIFDDIRVKIEENLTELTSLIPAYDASCAGILAELSGVAGSLKGMLEELKGMIHQGSLCVSLEEFTSRLNTLETEWKEGGLGAKMLMAKTCLKGLVLTSQFSKDPVNLSTGNFYYEKEDLKIRGRMPLVFSRSYNALDESGGSLGLGWSHSLEERLTFPGEEAETPASHPVVVLHLIDGRELTFRLTKQDEEEAVYTDIHTGKEEIRKKEESYRYETGPLTYTFSGEGKLLHKKDEEGNALFYTYDETGVLTEVKQHTAGSNDETLSGFFRFSYKEDGRLKTILDHTGRSLSFFYLEDRLTEVTDPEGHTISYRYTEEGRMRAVKNARGTLTVRNDYDKQGRIVKQKFPDKGEMHYFYDEKTNTTVLTERNGSRITYVQDEELRNIKTIYHDSEESCTYNDRDEKTSVRDRLGHTTRYHYDNKGKVTGIVNALGEKTDLTYNGEGKLLTLKQNGVTLLKNAYDAKGRLLKNTDALGRVFQNHYNENGLLTRVSYPDGSQMELTYDERGNIVKIKEADGRILCYGYDALNRIVETTDGWGSKTTYAYDKKDKIVEVTNPEGRRRAYAYNESGKVTRIEDFDGGITTLTYNNLNKPESITDKEGRVTKRSYDRMWNVAEETAPTGAVTRYTYDADNRLSQVTLHRSAEAAPESVLCYHHDAAGNLLRTSAGKEDGLVTTASYEYDALNRVTAVTDGAGGRTTYTYHPNGKVSSITDPEGKTRSFTYNDAGELVKVTDEQGREKTYTYTLLGKVHTITDPVGRVTTYTYAPGGRLMKITYPEGRFLSYAYDEAGRVKEKENSDGYRLLYTYDSMGRVVEVTSSEGQKKSYTYDALGNVTSLTDASGATTRYTYTISGKLSTVTDALGSRTEYRYDALDNLIHISKKGGEGEPERTTTYKRNPFGQLECMVDALGEEEHYTYDAFGRMQEKQDREGNRTTFAYTPDGRVEQIHYGDGSEVTLQYDALRRLTQVKDTLGITTIKRNAEGAAERITGQTGQTVSYRYGRMGEKLAMTYPDGREVSYHYDENLRLTRVDIPVTPQENTHGTDMSAITYHYDGQGRLIKKQFPEGLRTHWHYDRKGQLTELVHEDEEGILDRYAYTYDDMGNKTGIRKERRGLENENGSYHYTYDALGRLTGVVKDGAELRYYTYDAFGNRTMVEDYQRGSKTACTYDALNHLLTRQEERTGMGGISSMDEMGETGKSTRLLTYGYDKRGNLIQELEGDTLLHGYTYNAGNRLAHAWNHKGEEAFYTYNGLGQRVGRRTSIAGEEETETYLLDFTRPYHNLLGIEKGNSRKTFYWDGNVIAMEEQNHTPVLPEESMQTDGNMPITGNIPTAGMHYYLLDELGSPLRVNGYAEGDKSAYLTYGYDEFGNDLYEDLEEAGIPNPYSRQGEEQPFGYTGYRYDSISHSYFAQAREYQPENGRFNAEDVIKGNGAFPETLNDYGYCLNNPMGYVDLNGKSFVPQPVYTGQVYLIEKYRSLLEEYENSLVESPQLPEVSNELPDYTEEINEFMEKKVEEFNNMPIHERYFQFYNQVKTGGEMDIKWEDIWNAAFDSETMPYVPAFIFNGEVIDPGILGNMTYGYLGTELGFTPIGLYYGGGWAHMKNVTESNIKAFECLVMPNYGDAPEDIQYIEAGIDWYWDEKKQNWLSDCEDIE